MTSEDLIAASFKLDWASSLFTALMPANNFFYGRAKVPDGVSGFPYAEVTITEVAREVRTILTGNQDMLVTYNLNITVWTAQGQSGGTTTGDPLTDQGNIRRALESVLNFITPNNPWNYVGEFLHCVKESPGYCGPDDDLYLGKDVLKSTQNWSILVIE